MDITVNEFHKEGIRCIIFHITTEQWLRPIIHRVFDCDVIVVWDDCLLIFQMGV